MSDYRDPELENMLGRLSGAYPDSNTAYVAVTSRVRQVKRRRAFVASTAACIALFGVGALAASGGSASQNVSPAAESSTKSSTETSSVSSVKNSDGDTESSASVEPTTSSVDESSSSAPNTLVSTPSRGSSGSNNSNRGPSTSAGSSNSVGSNSGPGSANSGSSNSGTSNSGTSNSGPDTSNSAPGTSNSGSSQPTVNAPNGSTTYTTDGGKVTVVLTDGQLSLGGSVVTAGFTEKVNHNRADRVEVEFADGTVTWVIRVDLVNGQPVPTISHR